MTITQASHTDLEELNTLFDGYRVFYKRKSDKTASKAFLKERIDKSESVIFIARNVEGVATGFTQLYPLFSSTRLKRVWLLNDLFVAPNYRGQGFSKALMERAKVHCIETGGAGLSLETEKTNLIGNQLYLSTGWTLDEEHNYYYWEVD